jgi:hypothetical protein
LYATVRCDSPQHSLEPFCMPKGRSVLSKHSVQARSTQHLCGRTLEGKQMTKPQIVIQLSLPHEGVAVKGPETSMKADSKLVSSPSDSCLTITQSVFRIRRTLKFCKRSLKFQDRYKSARTTTWAPPGPMGTQGCCAPTQRLPWLLLK